VFGLGGWASEKRIAQRLDLFVPSLTLNSAKFVDICDIDANPGTALTHPAGSKVKLWRYAEEPP
jgi:hypothetical protein